VTARVEVKPTRGFRRIKLALAIRLLVVARWLMLRTQPPAWARLAQLARLFVRGSSRAVLDEAIDVLRGGEPGTRLVREMVEGTTREELEDLAWGALVFDPERVP